MELETVDQEPVNKNRLRGLSRVDKAGKIGRTGRVGRVRRVGGEKGRSATINRGRTVLKKNSWGRVYRSKWNYGYRGTE